MKNTKEPVCAWCGKTHAEHRDHDGGVLAKVPCGDLQSGFVPAADLPTVHPTRDDVWFWLVLTRAKFTRDVCDRAVEYGVTLDASDDAEQPWQAKLALFVAEQIVQ